MFMSGAYRLLKPLKSYWLASWDTLLTGLLVLSILGMLFYTLSPRPIISLELEEVSASAYAPAIDPRVAQTSVPTPMRKAHAAFKSVSHIPISIDINQATASELERLPGIGPKLASRIIDFRKQHGHFNAPEDLLSVSGIGPKSLEKLRPFLILD